MYVMPLSTLYPGMIVLNLTITQEILAAPKELYFRLNHFKVISESEIL